MDKYKMGPIVRIGVLQRVNELKFKLIGKYKFQDKIFDENWGIWRAKIKKSYPAKFSYLLIHKKITDKKKAEDFLKEHPRFSLLEVGNDYKINDKVITTKEWWIYKEKCNSYDEADRLRQKCEYADYIDILETVEEKPKGIIILENEKGEKYEINTHAFFESIGGEKDRVILQDVIVGIGFHWEHKENQRYRRSFDIIIDNAGKLTAVNELPLEEYLFSVNSSEMKADCPIELLKAQTIVARNTILATRGKHHYSDNFDICADDHCQCYRGSSRERESSIKAVIDTFGQVLVYNNKICDTRYSKICGGFMENFESVWYSEPVPYMISGIDAEDKLKEELKKLFPINTEEKARKYIEGDFPVFCNVEKNIETPSSVRYAKEYFKWSFKYTSKELANLIKRKKGIYKGRILDLIPIKRGDSGRIEKLKVVAENGEFFLGKELDIRFALHEKCLYSSFFVVDKEKSKDEIYFTIKGCGWGHGVGLCQIGATVMAAKGYNAEEILYHYFKNTNLIKMYEKDDIDYIKKYYHGQNREGERCFEFFNCYEVNICKAKNKGKCWENSGNYVNGKRIDTQEEKEKICKSCPYYKLQNKIEEGEL